MRIRPNGTARDVHWSRASQADAQKNALEAQDEIDLNPEVRSQFFASKAQEDVKEWIGNAANEEMQARRASVYSHWQSVQPKTGLVSGSQITRVSNPNEKKSQ